MASDLTPYAAAGYSGAANDRVPTSPAHWAHCLGAHLKQTGQPAPFDVRMGRGDSIRANGCRFLVLPPFQAPRFERIE